MILKHTNGDISVHTDDATPRQKRVPFDDTDIESENSDKTYKTPVILQKKKKVMPAPVESSSWEGEESSGTEVIQVKLKPKVIEERKKNKGQRPVPDNATGSTVRSITEYLGILSDSDINGCLNIEKVYRCCNSSSESKIKVSYPFSGLPRLNFGLNPPPEPLILLMLNLGPRSARSHWHWILLPTRAHWEVQSQSPVASLPEVLPRLPP